MRARDSDTPTNIDDAESNSVVTSVFARESEDNIDFLSCDDDASNNVCN